MRRLLGAALAALLLCACSTGGPSTTRTNAPAAATTFANVQPKPPSTKDTTTTLPGADRPPIVVGDMNTPEQFMLGALYQQALTAQGYHVELTRDIGTTAVSEHALAQGSLDIYPQYLNKFATDVMGDHSRFPSLTAAYAAARAYAKAHKLTLLAPTPFSDTAGIAVLTPFARRNHLRSLSDLKRVSAKLTLGVPLEYSLEPDGLPALERAYKFKSGLTTSANIGNQYDMLRNGTIQAAYVATSDGELASDDITTLSDPQGFYGYGNVVPVIRNSVLKQEGPAFAQTIERVDSLLTQRAIRGLNAEMSQSSLDPEAISGEVARDFLQGYGMAPPPPWSTTTSTTTTATRSTTR
ncbi:MAG: hypothetical protein J2O48_06625 [Solirubrobacterales bacterium]|nr:hypothetical protein [Solirubrobacterales bacterium]